VNRRALIGLLGGAGALPSMRALAQEPGRVYRLGFLIPTRRESPAVAAFFDELRLHGFIEGQNLTVDPSGFGASNEQIAELAATVVKAAPDAIVAGPDLQLRAVQSVTRTIPAIGMTEDMVAAGFAVSLARPGGNITGISLLSPELDGKRQALLMEAVPAARRMAALADSRVTPPQHLEGLRNAARARGVELAVFGVGKPEEIAPAVAAARTGGAEAINFLATPLFLINSGLVFDQVAAARLPAIYQWPELAEQGGLAGYGPRFAQVYRQRARMVVKILRGAKPAELPVEQPTHFELVINLKAARAIEHEVPAGLVLRADRVIE
jgi:putative tryptophan/tyrosine transport system substrate-binding protein